MSILDAFTLMSVIFLVIVGTVFALDPLFKVTRGVGMTFGYISLQAFYGALFVSFAFYLAINFLSW